jgi:hypothetical protein
VMIQQLRSAKILHNHALHPTLQSLALLPLG